MPERLEPTEFHPALKVPKTPETMLAMRRDELKPEVRKYADNLHAQILQIHQEFDAKNSEEFESAARAGGVPNDALRRLLDLTNQLVEVLKGGEAPRAQVIFVESTPEGKEARIDLVTIHQESVQFYNIHNLPEFTKDFPEKVLLSPESESRLREAMRAGFDRAIIFPSLENQQIVTDKLFEELAANPAAGLPDRWQYTAYSAEQVAIKAATARNRPHDKNYLLLYQSKIPQTTYGLTAEQAEAELDKIFGQTKWNGLTFQEYLVLQRREAESHLDHSFDTYSSKVPSRSGWTWLLDSRIPFGNLDASWGPMGRQKWGIGVSHRRPEYTRNTLGARAVIIVEIL